MFDLVPDGRKVLGLAKAIAPVLLAVGVFGVGIYFVASLANEAVRKQWERSKAKCELVYHGEVIETEFFLICEYRSGKRSLMRER